MQRVSETRKTLAFHRLDSTIVIVMNGPISDEDWKEYTNAFAASLKTIKRLVIYDLGGGGPNAKQRAIVAKIGDDAGVQAPDSVIFTDNVTVRHLTTALNWLARGTKFRALPYKEEHEGMSRLGLDSGEIARIMAMRYALTKRVLAALPSEKRKAVGE